MFAKVGSLCRKTAFASVVLLTLGVGLLGARPALAHYTFCRSDPVVSLLNLGQLDLSANISDSLSDVSSVVYVVHAPVGTKLLSVLDTSGLMGPKESVQFYADDTTNTFDVYTTVYTGQEGIAVTAQSALVSVLNVNLGLASVAGMSNIAIHTHFTALL